MASNTKVCVIGAGAAGLCSTRHLVRHLNFDVQVYEQTNDIGGTWVYKEATGLDENGLPIHSSMYRDLRTNLPARIMNFPDYLEMDGEETACVSHEMVRSYLQSYALHFDLLKHVKFNTRVERVQLQSSADSKDKWYVQTRNLKTNQREELTFDAIMICNGHYFDPYLPAIPGIETFQGTRLHSHSYRKPEDFSKKTVLILGAASSGIDIGIDLATHGCRVYLSHNNERLNSILPPNMTQVMGVERIQGQNFLLNDQTVVTADVFVYCSGYRFSFPFLEESCGIKVDDNYVTPLYKHLINIEHPTMCIVGIPTQVSPFPLFHMQVQYFLALLKGATSLPSKSVMLEDSRLQTAKKRHAHKLENKQWEYNDSLAVAGGFDRLPMFYKIGYGAWKITRKANLWHYKKAKFVVSEDGNNVQIIMPQI